MKNKQNRFVPVTPGGSLCMHLIANTEEQAWKNLIKHAQHMPYKTRAGFEQRGYTITVYPA